MFQKEAEKKKKRDSDFEKKKKKYAKQTKTMFLHAYNSYMVNFDGSTYLLPKIKSLLRR